MEQAKQRHYERCFTQDRSVRARNNSFGAELVRNDNFMGRRMELQNKRPSMAAGVETSNILDAKYMMLRQRGQLKTEGGSFMR